MIRNLHVVETFTLHTIERVEGRERPIIKQEMFERGEMISDPEMMQRVEQARDEGTLNHNSFVAVMVEPGQGE